MTNPKLQAICDLDLPILWVARGALRVEPKNLFLGQNFQNDKNFSEFAQIRSEDPLSSIVPHQ